MEVLSCPCVLVVFATLQLSLVPSAENFCPNNPDFCDKDGTAACFTLPDSLFSVFCSCNENVFGEVCQYIDACETGDHICKLDETCFRYPADPGYICTRDPPQCKNNEILSLNPFKETVCTSQFNPCAYGIYDCEQICKGSVNSDNIENGMFTCACIRGYGLHDDGKSCSDVDECVSGRHTCQQRCVNTEASFRCGCDEGFTDFGDKNCSDIDECESQRAEDLCENDGRCNNTYGSYTCQCRVHFGNNVPKWEGDKCEVNYDECSTNKDLCEHDCVDSDGSYTCKCREGFTASGSKCVDVNECNSNPCRNKASCNNEENKFTCTCADGWTGVTCDVDLTECETATCLNGKCTDAEGSYSCSCNEGYKLHNDTACSDLDECHMNKDLCKEEMWACKNLPGSFECDCTTGYIGATCSDKDECKENENKCVQKNNSQCENTRGSFLCTCIHGYREVKGQGCVDIKECREENLCDVDSTACNEVGVGNYTCECLSGFEVLPGNSTHCSDIDECVRYGYCNHVNVSTCNNTPGSYMCLCELGGKLVEEKDIKCDICAVGTWGEKCQEYCFCRDNKPCAKETGECPGKDGTRCQNHYSGVKCNERSKCENPHRWGPNCMDICLCANNKRCDKKTGRCPRVQQTSADYGDPQCQRGWRGEKCDVFFSNGCKIDPCRNGSTCFDLFQNRLCFCQPGYTGYSCETQLNCCQRDGRNSCGELPCTSLVNGYRCTLKRGLAGVLTSMKGIQNGKSGAGCVKLHRLMMLFGGFVFVCMILTTL